MNIPLSPCVAENLVPRDGFGRSCPASVRLIIYLALTHGIPPHFRGGILILIIQATAIGSVRAYRVTQLRTDGVHYRESAGTGPVNIKVVTERVLPLFPTPTIGMKWVCWMYAWFVQNKRIPHVWLPTIILLCCIILIV